MGYDLTSDFGLNFG